MSSLDGNILSRGGTHISAKEGRCEWKATWREWAHIWAGMPIPVFWKFCQTAFILGDSHVMAEWIFSANSFWRVFSMDQAWSEEQECFGTLPLTLQLFDFSHWAERRRLGIWIWLTSCSSGPIGLARTSDSLTHCWLPENSFILQKMQLHGFLGGQAKWTRQSLRNRHHSYGCHHSSFRNGWWTQQGHEGDTSQRL